MPTTTGTSTERAGARGTAVHPRFARPAKAKISGDELLLALLELSHPTAVERVAVAGRRLRVGPAPGAVPAAKADMCVLAPSTREGLSGSWRAGAATLASERLAGDGIAFVFAGASTSVAAAARAGAGRFQARRGASARARRALDAPHRADLAHQPGGARRRAG
jgi:hypothetical protein